LLLISINSSKECPILKILFAQSDKGVGEQLRVDEHELVPVLVLCHLVDILADELKTLLAQHRVVIEFSQYVNLNNIVSVQVLDQKLTALDLERLYEVLFSSYVQVYSDRLYVVGQVSCVDVFEHCFDHVRPTVLD